MKKERRRYPRVPVAADIGEPVELMLFERGKGKESGRAHARRVPAILTNISSGGMAFVVFGAKEMFDQVSRIKLVANLPGFNRANIDAQIMHVRGRSQDMQTLGVRFVNTAKTFRDKIKKMANDYLDCDNRTLLRVPEACLGHECHYFGLCQKPQKLSLRHV